MFICLFVHSFIRLFICLFVCSFVFFRSFVRPFFHPFIRSSINSFICLFIHSFAHPFVRSFIHSFGRSFVHSYHLHPPSPVYYLIVVCCHCQLSGWLLRCNGGMDTPLSLLVLILILILILVLFLVLILFLVLVLSLSSSSSSSCNPHCHCHHPSSSSFFVWLVAASEWTIAVFIQQSSLDFAQRVKSANIAACPLLCVMPLRQEIGKLSKQKPSKYCQPQLLSLLCQKWWSSVQVRWFVGVFFC